MNRKIPSSPRVLVVTPEVAYLPHAMGNIADYVGAKAGGLADVSAALISALFEQGADVHVAVPEYRALYNPRLPQSLRRGAHSIRSMLPEERIHLAQDRYLPRTSSIPSARHFCWRWPRGGMILCRGTFSRNWPTKSRPTVPWGY